MKQALRLAGAVLCVTLVSLVTARAQDQYTEGTVERVNLVHILPGHFNAYMDDMKNNLIPIWEAEKSAGLIEGYNVFFNQTKSSIDDWDIGISPHLQEHGHARWPWHENPGVADEKIWR